MTNNKLNPLSKQILLRGFVPVILIVFSIVVVQYYFYAQQQLKNNHQNLAVLVQNLAIKIEGSNQLVANLPKTMAQAQTNGLFGDRASSSQYVKDILITNREITGASFGYEVNADQSDKAFLLSVEGNYIAKGLDNSGRFLPYWFRNSQQQNTISLKPLIDMEDSLYYQGVKALYTINQKALPMITEPYNYEGKLIVEYTYPIILDHEFKGIASVDRALDDVLSLLQLESQTHGIDIFLISNQGRFISSTTAQNQLTRTLDVNNTPYKELFSTPIISKNEPWFVEKIDPFDSSKHFYTSAHVQTGNWLVIVRKPKELVMGTLWQTAISLFVLSMLGLLICAWVIHRVLSKTSNRVNLALNAANELAKGEIPEVDKVQAKGNDEVAALLSAFEQVIEHYKNIKIACQSMAKGDFHSHISPHSEKDILSKSLNLLAKKLNLSEQKMLEAMQQTEQATHAKSQFLANMSHEIRTPMNAVLGLSRLCLNTELSGQQQDYIEKINYSGHALLHVIDDILDFSKVESGNLAIENIDFDLISIFQNLATFSKQSALEKGLELLFDVPYNEAWLKGDPLRLGQVLTNLCNNAIKFTHAGEVLVRVVLTSQNSKYTEVKFDVVDQGIGINESQQEKLFSAFSQAEDSTTRHYGGTGLGLVISKSLVELMGGNIKINSKEGVGTKVSFTIQFEQAAKPVSATPVAYPEYAQDINILIVDDNATARKIMADQCQRLSLKYKIAANATDAIKTLNTSNVTDTNQMVLIDGNMSSLGGLQTVNAIRANSKYINIPIAIMLTDEYNAKNATTFTQQNVNHFVSKPLSDSDLLGVIEQLFTKQTIKTAQNEKWRLATNAKLNGLHLLVAEDNIINQQIVGEYLEKIGVSFDIVENGLQAIEATKNQQYHGILMDLQMPDMGGIEATQAIRCLPDTQNLPIIAMTANAMQQHIQECLNAGMNAHISKPIEANILYSAIEEHILNQPAYALSSKDKQEVLATSEKHVDYAAALVRSSNNEAQMVKLMSIFKHSHTPHLAVLQQAILNNQHTQSCDIAHNISGVADYMGASQLAVIAKEYEYFDSEVGTKDHQQKLSALYQELKVVLVELEAIISGYQSSQAGLSAVTPSQDLEVSLDAQGNPFSLSVLQTESETQNLSTKKQTILIVDDDPVSVTILQGILSPLYQLDIAKNGKKALQLLLGPLPDLILLDIHMPVMDGYEVYKTIKQSNKLVDIPIIFLTTDNTEEVKSLNLGAEDFVSKPYVNDVLTARVNTHLLLKQKTDLLRAKGLTDELTQVANSRAYKTRITDELARGKRDKTSISLLMLELDEFKLYNDNYGHLAGDKCLQKVASFLSLTLKRSADFVARIEGEKFAVILPNTPLKGAIIIANELRSSIESLLIEHTLSKHNVMTLSIGAVTVDLASIEYESQISSDELMEQADVELYKAKELGGNQVCSHTFV